MLYRLLCLPSERKDDIVILIDHFLKELQVEDKISFSTQALHKLISYNWEGNIRQLKNIITRIVTLTRNSVINVDDLPEELQLSTHKSENTDPIKLESVEKDHIIKVLELTNGNRKKAAELLGIHRNTLAKKIKDFKL